MWRIPDPKYEYFTLGFQDRILRKENAGFMDRAEEGSGSGNTSMAEEQEVKQQQLGQQQDQEQGGGTAEEEQSRMMKPWEQHSAVISIPRFDYKAPSSLLHHSHSGFLVTCPIS